MLAQWTDFESSYSREVNTVAEALDLISELRSTVTEPAMVEFLDDPDGPSFGYAVGREKTVLTFQYSNDPPYYASLTDTASEDAWFCYAQQYSEYPGENMISHDDGQHALREFFDSRKLPSAIQWEKL
jgi:hypothetical protein